MRMSRSLYSLGFGAFAVLCRYAVASAQATCPSSVPVAAGTLVSGIPAAATKVFVIDQNGARNGAISTAPTGGSWTPGEADAGNLVTAFLNGAKELEFADAVGKAVCRSPFTVAPSTAPVREPSRGPTALGVTDMEFSASECPRAGAAWEQELSKQPGHRTRFTELVFIEAGSGSDANICYYNRDYGVVGDPIYTAVFSNESVAWSGVTYEPCAAQSAAPNVLRSSEQFPSIKQSSAWQLYPFLERRCYNSSVEVTITGAAAGTSARVSQRYALSQYDRYRGTLQAGILFPTIHKSDFALRSLQSDTSKHFIYDRAPTNRGPEYIASLDLYAIFKYLPSILGRSDPKGYGMYPGRDPIHDQDFFDRIGAVLGVGITNPSQLFTAGLSFELVYGVSITWSAEFLQVSELADGVSTTTPFIGTAGEIPTVRRWRERPTVGLSLDLRYLSLLFSGNR